MIPFISNLFNLPVTRKEVLKRAKKIKKSGLCYTIRDALHKYNIYSRNPEIYFPKFERKNALQFGADKFYEWWWIPYVWDTGRMDFLDWLIEQYKDDKTNLRKL
jgi:hypothetical protein